MSHNVAPSLEQIKAQAEHLSWLKIAKRAQSDLFYLCHDILGYDLMTKRTHGDLCEFTKSLIPHNVKSLSVETVAQDTLYDPNRERTRHDSPPHSTPHEPQPTTTSDSGLFSHADTKKSQENSPVTGPTTTKNTPENVSDTIALESQEMTVAHRLDTRPEIPLSAIKNVQQGGWKPEDQYAPFGYDQNKKALFIMMPRNTFKSSVVTIGFAIQFILNNPDGRVLVDSETYSKAKNFLAEIKGHLEDNTMLRRIFQVLFDVLPDQDRKNSSTRWKDSEMDLSCRTKKRKEASLTASGIDKSINGMHYDLIICDDLHSEKNVTNKEQIEQVIQHWKLSLSLLEPNKYMIVIGTRWDYKDLYSYLLKKESDRFNVYIRQAINPDGTLLFPEILTENFLAAQRKSQGGYMYSCQYMNSPVDDENAMFKESDMIQKPWELVRNIPINWYMAVDPSLEGETSDYAAFVIAGFDAMMNLYVKHITRKKMSYGQIIEEMFRLYAIHKPKEIALETIAQAKQLQYMLANETKRRGFWLPVKEIVSRETSKEARIEALSPYYEYHRVIHVTECPDIDKLEDELTHFPKAENDDVSDALATILEIAKPAKHTKSPEEREERDRKIAKFTKARSLITKV